MRILNADWNDVAIADSGIDSGGDDRARRLGAELRHGRMGARGRSRASRSASATRARRRGARAGGRAAGTRRGGVERPLVPPRLRARRARPSATRTAGSRSSPGRSSAARPTRRRRASLLEHDRSRTPRRPRRSARGFAGQRPPDRSTAGRWGDATLGGVWYSINMTLVWAAARIAPDLAWDEWRRMTLGSAHRGVSGDLGGHAVRTRRVERARVDAPGPHVGARRRSSRCRRFPVNNSHSHAQPLLAYLRLLGVEPTPARDARGRQGRPVRQPGLRAAHLGSRSARRPRRGHARDDARRGPRRAGYSALVESSSIIFLTAVGTHPKDEACATSWPVSRCSSRSRHSRQGLAPRPRAARSGPAPCRPTRYSRVRHGAQIPIDHIVVLMQENRSFDHYFGQLRAWRRHAPRRVANPNPLGGDPIRPSTRKYCEIGRPRPHGTARIANGTTVSWTVRPRT